MASWRAVVELHITQGEWTQLGECAIANKTPYKTHQGMWFGERRVQTWAGRACD